MQDAIHKNTIQQVSQAELPTQENGKSVEELALTSILEPFQFKPIFCSISNPRRRDMLGFTHIETYGILQMSEALGELPPLVRNMMLATLEKNVYNLMLRHTTPLSCFLSSLFTVEISAMPEKTRPPKVHEDGIDFPQHLEEKIHQSRKLTHLSLEKCLKDANSFKVRELYRIEKAAEFIANERIFLFLLLESFVKSNQKNEAAKLLNFIRGTLSLGWIPFGVLSRQDATCTLQIVSSSGLRKNHIVPIPK